MPRHANLATKQYNCISAIKFGNYIRCLNQIRLGTAPFVNYIRGTCEVSRINLRINVFSLHKHFEALWRTYHAKGRTEFFFYIIQIVIS